MIRWVSGAVTRMKGLAIFAAFLLLASVLVATSPNAAQVAVTEKAWPVSMMLASPQNLSPVLLTYGRLESRQTAALKASLSARVATVHRPEGSWVEEGDLILQLDPAEAEIALDLANAGLARSEANLRTAESEYAHARALTEHHESLSTLARTNLTRFMSLHARGMVSDSALDEVRQQASERAMILAGHRATVDDFPNVIARYRADVEEARARVDQARLDVQQTAVIAPFPGRVMRITVAAGERAMPGNTLVEIADYSQLELRSTVTSEIAVRLQESLARNEQIVASASQGGREIDFHLDRLAGHIKAGQGGVDALFGTATDRSLMLGSVMNLEVRLPPEDDVIAMPVHAVYENDRIYRIRDQRLENISVKRVGDYIDAEGNFRVLIRSGELQQGDVLMTTQLPTAIDGLLVDPVAEQTTSVAAGLAAR